MKKISKFLIIILIIGIIIICTQSQAANADTNTLAKRTGSYKVGMNERNGFDSKAGPIIGVIRGIGVIVSVGVLAILGIKYMAGSAEERAEYKKDMIPYLIGALLTFATSALLFPLYDIFVGYAACGR